MCESQGGNPIGKALVKSKYKKNLLLESFILPKYSDLVGLYID